MQFLQHGRKKLAREPIFFSDQSPKKIWKLKNFLFS